jgi:hypothetical protein
MREVVRRTPSPRGPDSIAGVLAAISVLNHALAGFLPNRLNSFGLADLTVGSYQM